MEAKTKTGKSVVLQHCISVGLVGDKARMREWAIKDGGKDILTITGTASSHIEVESKQKDSKDKDAKNRPTVYVKGAFRGVNMITGEEYISGQLILPDSASAYICALVDDAPEPKKLAIDLTVKCLPSEKSIIGYKYEVAMNSAEVEQPTDEKAGEQAIHQNGRAEDDAAASTEASGSKKKQKESTATV